MAFLGLSVFIIFLLAYFRKKQTRHQNDVEQRFWDRESQANSTRRQDISGLPYINIPLDKFPIGICKDDAAIACEKTLTALSTQKILNLGNQTNTDLKLKYGPGNLPELAACEQHFSTLCTTLVDYAEALTAAGFSAEAVTVLEFGISCGCDLSKNYLLLADLYVQSGAFDKLADLTETAATLDSPMKNSILRRLEEKATN